jgi:hypothetical protein
VQEERVSPTRPASPFDFPENALSNIATSPASPVRFRIRQQVPQVQPVQPAIVEKETEDLGGLLGASPTGALAFLTGLLTFPFLLS